MFKGIISLFVLQLVGAQYYYKYTEDLGREDDFEGAGDVYDEHGYNTNYSTTDLVFARKAVNWNMIDP